MSDKLRVYLFAWLGLGLNAPSALAHSGPHLDDETLEAIFHFMDRAYQGFLPYLPLLASIGVGSLLIACAIHYWHKG